MNSRGIQNVFRDDYLTAISALSVNGNPGPYVRALLKAQEWTRGIPSSTLENALGYLEKTNAYKTPREGRLLIPNKTRQR
jgi:hypothetical protein